MLFLMLFYGKPLESHLIFVYKSLFPRDKRQKSVFRVKWFGIKTHYMYDTDSKVSPFY